MGDINKDRPDLAAKGWTQEMWDARDSLSPLEKAFSTDDSFERDWGSGSTRWQQYTSGNPGKDPRTGDPYVPGSMRNGLTGQMSDADGNPLPKEAIGADAPGAQLDTSFADAERERMTGMLEGLQQQAATGGGAWEQTFKDATAKAGASAQALGQSTPGVGYQSQLRNIGNAQGAVAQRAVGEESILRNQAKLDAQDNLGQLLGDMGSQDINQAGAKAGVRQNARSMNVAHQEQARKDALGVVGGSGQAAVARLPWSDGGQVPGRAPVFGDDEANDTVPAMLSPGEVVIPRSISHDPDAAADFVRSLNAQKGVPHFAEGGVAPWKPGDLDPTSQERDGTGAIHRKKDFLGFNGQAPSVDNGGLLQTGQYEQTRGAAGTLQQQLAARAAGAGPSVAPQMLQQASDQNIAAALQAAQSGRGAPAGDILQTVAATGAGAASDAGRQTAVEQSMGQQAAAGFGSGQRARELQLARAQQEAAFRNTQMNVGIGLEQQAMLRNIASGTSQAAAALASAGSGDRGYDGAYQSDYYGDRGGPADLSSSEPDFGEWENPYGKAHGGVVGDDDEKRRAREFINSLQGAA